MVIIVKAEYYCLSEVVYKRPAVIKIGEAVLTSVIPRDRTERDIINGALEAEVRRTGDLQIGATEGYGG